MRAGRVDDGVHAAVRCGDLGQHRSTLLGGGHVQLMGGGADASAMRGHRSGTSGFFVAPIGDGDVTAAGSQHQRDRRPEPAAAADHEGRAGRVGEIS